ncbi:hypothetical protein [Gloeobacter kilaueensis]|uniref:hypothetical protein n=1 Tax=Gloeobacter kilaueensis TaxID=1416614 RepID=UPI0011834BD2|nr:hypothetical protein [Gloeobacter kilaueensis]
MFTAIVGADRCVQLPGEVPEGQAEIVVLVRPATGPKDAQVLQECLDELEHSKLPRRSKEEIDQSLELERNSWD